MSTPATWSQLHWQWASHFGWRVLPLHRLAMQVAAHVVATPRLSPCSHVSSTAALACSPQGGARRHCAGPHAAGDARVAHQPAHADLRHPGHLRGGNGGCLSWVTWYICSSGRKVCDIQAICEVGTGAARAGLLVNSYSSVHADLRHPGHLRGGDTCREWLPAAWTLC